MTKAVLAVAIGVGLTLGAAAATWENMLAEEST